MRYDVMFKGHSMGNCKEVGKVSVIIVQFCSQKMIKKSYMKLFYLVLTFFCSVSVCKAQETEISAIKQTINNLFDGMRKSDTALLRSAFAEGAMLQSVNKNKQGHTR